MQQCKKILAVFFITIFSFVQVSFCTESYIWNPSTLETSGEEATGNFLNLECGSAILIEKNSGSKIYFHR